MIIISRRGRGRLPGRDRDRVGWRATSAAGCREDDALRDRATGEDRRTRGRGGGLGAWGLRRTGGASARGLRPAAAVPVRACCGISRGVLKERRTEEGGKVAEGWNGGPVGGAQSDLSGRGLPDCLTVEYIFE